MAESNEFQKRVDWLAAHEIPMKQNLEEIAFAFGEVQKIKPNAFLEIGSLCGGSLYVYAGACAPGASIVSVDFPREDEFRAKLDFVAKQLAVEGFKPIVFLGASHSADMLARVSGHYPVLDGMHIDGNHGTVVRYDFNCYGKLIRPGGIILMHDVAGAPEVAKLWAEIETAEKTLRVVRGPEPGRRDGALSGIGIVYR